MTTVPTFTPAELKARVKRVCSDLSTPHQLEIKSYPMRIENRSLEALEGYLDVLSGSKVDISEDPHVNVIILDPETVSESSEMVDYVITHELVHLALGHWWFLCWAETEDVYDAEMLEDLKWVFEEEADFYAIAMYGHKRGAIELAKKLGRPNTVVMAYYARNEDKIEP